MKTFIGRFIESKKLSELSASYVDVVATKNARNNTMQILPKKIINIKYGTL